MIKKIAHSDVMKIIVVTTLIFVVVHFIRITFLISGEDTRWFNQYCWLPLTLPASWKTWLHQPWSLITYFFVEFNFMQIAGNMIWLWIFGNVLEDLQGNYKVLPIYLVGGLIGGMAYLITSSFVSIPPTYHEYGSTAAVFAVATAVIIYKPHYQSWLLVGMGIKIWMLGCIFLGLQIIQIEQFSWLNLAIPAGGILTGILYHTPFGKVFEGLSEVLQKMSRYFGNNQNFIQTSTQKKQHHMPYQTLQVNTQKIDSILDKIHAQGIDSLTTKEKELLDKYSKL